MTIQMKAIEQYFHVVLYKVVLTFKSVDETLVCDHSNESYCFKWYCLVCCTRWFQLLSLVEKTLECDNSNESY